MTRHITTARLALTPYSDVDVAALHACWTEPGVRRYLWDDIVITLEQARAVVASSVSDWEQHGYGQWTIRSRGRDELIGFCGFRPAEWDAAPELLVGLMEQWWRRGLATEAAMAALRFAFGQPDVAAVVAATDPPNHASIRLMTRLGMTPTPRGLLGGRPTLFYRIERAAFADI